MMGPMEPEEQAPEPTRTGDDWKPAARIAIARLGSGLMGGFLCGLVIGGIGGRLAMFLLRVTSDPALSGRETDDGFIIGSFTGSTFFLLIFTALIGLIGGLFYLIVRNWFSERTRPLMMGLLSAAVGGALIVRPDGIDFTELEPRPLAIALFVVIPALGGIAMSLLIERLLRSAEARSKRGLILVLLPLLPVAALGPFGLLVLLAVFGFWFVGWGLDRYIPLSAWWGSPVVTWLGRVALAGWFVYATVGLVKDSVEIL